MQIFKKYKRARYLGVVIKKYDRCVKTRIGITKQAFVVNLEKVLKNRKMTIELRKRISHSYYVCVCVVCVKIYVGIFDNQRRKQNKFECFRNMNVLLITREPE